MNDYDALENRLLQMRLPPAFNSMVLTEAAYAIRDLRAERDALTARLEQARRLLDRSAERLYDVDDSFTAEIDAFLALESKAAGLTHMMVPVDAVVALCDAAEALKDLVSQIHKFAEKYGEADFYTGQSNDALAKLALREALVHARKWISKAGHTNGCEWYANYDSAMCTCGRLKVYDAAIDALAAQERKP